MSGLEGILSEKGRLDSLVVEILHGDNLDTQSTSSGSRSHDKNRTVLEKWEDGERKREEERERRSQLLYSYRRVAGDLVNSPP